MRKEIIDYMEHVTGCARSDCELCFDAVWDGLADMGWHAVPADATEDMVNSQPALQSANIPDYEAIWSAMLSAAPDISDQRCDSELLSKAR